MNMSETLAARATAKSSSEVRPPLSDFADTLIGSPTTLRTSSENDRLSRARLTKSSTSTTDRKSTRLNSSHMSISYAVFCLKKQTRGLRSQRPEAVEAASAIRRLAWCLVRALARLLAFGLWGIHRITAPDLTGHPGCFFVRH